jgi:hypothetical protein
MKTLDGALLKNKNCLTCEAVLPNTFGNLANHSNEAALARSFASRSSTGWLYITFLC